MNITKLFFFKIIKDEDICQISINGTNEEILSSLKEIESILNGVGKTPTFFAFKERPNDET